MKEKGGKPHTWKLKVPELVTYIEKWLHETFGKRFRIIFDREWHIFDDFSRTSFAIIYDSHIEINNRAVKQTAVFDVADPNFFPGIEKIIDWRVDHLTNNWYKNYAHSD